MKKLVSLVLVAVLLLGLLAGCGPSAPSTEGGEDGDYCIVSRDSDIVLLNYSDIGTFFPADITQNSEGLPASLAYESLVDFKEDMTLEWVLATGVEISDDYREYTFTLREGVTFSDGEPWNAAALQANFDMMLDESNAFRGVWLFDPVDYCEAIDEYTVKFVLYEPYAPFLNSLAAYAGFVSPKLIEAGPEAWKNTVVGTGQYTLLDYRSGESMTYVLNRNYWGYDPDICGGTALVAPEAGFNSITIKPVSEEATRIAMLLTGEADIINAITANNLQTVIDGGNQVFDVVGSLVGYLYMNCQKPALSDARVRKAISMAIDTDSLNEVVYGGMNLTCDSVIPPSISYYAKQGKIEYNIEKAKALMAEAGYAGGLKLIAWEENDTTDIQRGEFIQQQLEAIGIDLTVLPKEGGILATEVSGYDGDPREQGYDLYIRGYGADTFDADEMVGRYMTKNFTPYGSNYSFFSNEEFDELCDIGSKTVDPDIRAEVYARAQEILWEEMPVMPLLVTYMAAAHGPRIDYIAFKPSGGIEFKTATFKSN